MPPFTILHLELSQQSRARVVYTLCPHFLAISFTPGFSSANPSSPSRLLCRLFFQKFIFTASQHTSRWIISGIPKLLCTCSHLCLKYLSPSFISLYSYTFLRCQLSASMEPLPKPPEWLSFPFPFLVSCSTCLFSSMDITCNASFNPYNNCLRQVLLSQLYKWENWGLGTLNNFVQSHRSIKSKV